MKRYTLEQREEQIKRLRVRNRFNHEVFKRVSKNEENSELQRAFAHSAMSIYQELLDDIDYIFGKEETE